MSTEMILLEIERMSFEDKLLVLENTVRAIRQRQETDRKYEIAAEKARDYYSNDPEVQILSGVDSEFYEYEDHETK